jgi:hypothetical protein
MRAIPSYAIEIPKLDIIAHLSAALRLGSHRQRQCSSFGIGEKMFSVEVGGLALDDLALNRQPARPPSWDLRRPSMPL